MFTDTDCQKEIIKLSATTDEVIGFFDNKEDSLKTFSLLGIILGSRYSIRLQKTPIFTSLLKIVALGVSSIGIGLEKFPTLDLFRSSNYKVRPESSML